MKFEGTEIHGAWHSTGQRFFDSRGWFQEFFTQSKIAALSGLNIEIKQINVSRSNKGVVRGIHYSLSPIGQAKYVSVVEGAIDDYVVDIREGSPTFGRWQMFRLTSEDPGGLLIDSGLGHAFHVVSSSAMVCYGVSSEYDPSNEYALSPLCKTVNIGWDPKNIILSEKDRDAPDLMALSAAGLLPRHAR